MEYDILTAIHDAIQTALPTVYVGYYPQDYEFIHSYSTACLLKLQDNQVTAQGHFKYDIATETSVVLFSTQNIASVLSNEQTIIRTVVSTINSKTDCIVGRAGNLYIQAGDINQYQSPSSTGYNGKYIVRKLKFEYTIRKII